MLLRSCLVFVAPVWWGKIVLAAKGSEGEPVLEREAATIDEWCQRKSLTVQDVMQPVKEGC